MPGVKVVIANPETKGQCADSHLGEVSPSIHIDEGAVHVPFYGVGRMD